MPERPLNAIMRALLGVVGAAAIISGLAVAVAELRSISRGASLLSSLLIAAFAILVAAGGAYIIRGVIRGRIIVRRTRFP